MTRWLDAARAAERKAKPPPRFVAVIFANGEDDDLPGIAAAVANEAVQLDDRVYEPGDAISIIGRNLHVSEPFRVHGAEGTFDIGKNPCVVLNIDASGGRVVYFENCLFTVGGRDG